MKSFFVYTCLMIMLVCNAIANDDISVSVLYDYNTLGIVNNIATNDADIVILQYIDGGILYSSDKGKTWSQLHFVRYFWAENVVFLDETHCVIVGRNLLNNTLMVYHSSDKGKIWKQSVNAESFNSSIANEYRDIKVAVLSSKTLIASTNYGTVFLSEDGGNTWEKSASIGQTFSNSTLIMINANTVGLRRTDGYYLSEDKGKTWNIVPDFPITDIITSYIITMNGILLTTVETMEKKVSLWRMTDNGKKTALVFSNTSLPSVALATINKKEEIIVLGNEGNFSVYKTTNQGMSWDTVAKIDTINLRLLRCRFLTSTSAMITAATKTIVLLDTEKQSIEILSSLLVSEETTSIGSFTQKPDKSIVFTDGSYNRITESKDWGATWKQQPRTRGISSVVASHFVNDSIGFLMGATQNQGLYMTKDGGKTYQIMEVNCQAPYTSSGTRFSFKNQDYGIINFKNSNNKFGILITKNGGQSWYPQFTDGYIPHDPILVEGTPDSMIIAGSFTDKQVFIVSRDNGKTWNTITIADSIVIRDIYAFDDKNFLVSAISMKSDSLRIGRLYRTSDGGATWRNVMPLSQGVALTISYGNNLCIVGGISDSIIMSKDQGITWKPYCYLRQKADPALEHRLYHSIISDGNYIAVGVKINNPPLPPPNKSAFPFIIRIPIEQVINSVDAKVSENEIPLDKHEIQLRENPTSIGSTLKFSTSTTFNHDARVYIYDLKGKQLEDIHSIFDLDNNGFLHGSIMTNNFTPGTYILIIADNKSIAGTTVHVTH